MNAPKFVQIVVAAHQYAADVLYALDHNGRVWSKFGEDVWKLVDNRAQNPDPDA